MIVQREEEIKNFKPKTYYTINAKTKGYNLSWINKDNNSRVFDEEFANKIVSKTKGVEGEIVNIENNIIIVNCFINLNENQVHSLS